MMNLSQYRIVLYFIRPYWVRYIFILVMSLLLAVVECFNVAIFLPLFESFFGSGAQQSPAGGLLKAINNLIYIFPVSNKVIAACCVLVIFAILRFVLSLFSQYFIADVGGKVTTDLKRKILVKYSNAKYQYFLDTKQGHLIYISLTSPNGVAAVLYRAPILLNNFIILIGVLAFLFTVNVRATLMLLAIGVVFYIFISLISRLAIYRIGKKMAQASSDLNSVMNEFFAGIKHIYIHNAAKKWFYHHKKANDQYTRLFVVYNILLALPKYIIELTLIPFVMIAATVFIINNPKEFTSFIPTMGVFTMGVLRIIPYFSTIAASIIDITSNLNNCELIFNELNKKIDRDKTGTVEFVNLKDSIRFNSVYFSYDGRTDLLKDLNITFEKKRISAIVGKSGSGKSTIVNMILGLYRPSRGNIFLDGIDLYEYNLESRLARIGFVSQDPFIFHATIAENIAFGADYSMEEIIESAKMANAHEFISQFPNGYNTIVGERGMKLSGGQQQRIAIARAVVRKPQIFILDEATSALDNKSESLIQASINTISKNVTTIIIAHRLSTIQNADKILLLSDGQIKEEGRHIELMDRKGHYWRLHTSSLER